MLSCLYKSNVVFDFHNFQRHLFQSINNIKNPKYMEEKGHIMWPYWPLMSYFILWKICVFSIVAFKDFLDVLERKKLKSRNHRVQGSQRFFVTHRRTHVLYYRNQLINIENIISLIWKRLNKLLASFKLEGSF